MPAVNRSDFPYPLRTVDGGVDVEADTLTVTGTATFLGPVAIDGPFAFTNIVADTVTADSITSPLANLTVVNAQDVNANTVFSNNIRLLNGNVLQAVQTDANKDLITIANTGIGNNVLATSPSLVTPNIGAASATSLATGSLTSTTPIAASSGGTGQSLLSAVTVGKATNISGGATGQVVVQTGVGATGFVGPGTNGQVLTSNGTTSTFQNPAVVSLSSGVTGVLPVANGGTGVTTSTGTGAVVLNDTPTFVAPNLGDAEASSLHTTNNIGCDLKIFTTDIRVLSTSANSAVQTNALKDLVTVPNTGSGNNVLSNAPTLVTPVLGAASATSLSLGTALAVGSGGTGQTSLSAVTVGNATQSVSSTNVSGGANGRVVVQTGVGATGFITPSVAGGVLRSLGTGVSPQFSLATLPTVQYFTTGGAASYTSPAGCVYIFVYCVGAGGGGGGSSFGAGNQGAGGGGGGTTYGYLAAGTYAMTYGTGGAGGAGVGGATGSNGTVSTFGSLTGNFGSGGGGGATDPTFGGNGGGSSGTLYSGDSGQPPSSTSGGNGGRTLFTRGGRGGFYVGATTTATPTAGQDGGGGGGAASANTATAGAAGGNGFIVVHEFYQ